jgi:hypothetical protein
MTRIDAALHFNELGYIGRPFWPALSTIININKDVHPKLGEAKKLAALTAACEKRNLTIDQYRALEEKAAHPFYTVGELKSGEIIIPQRIVQSFLNHASMKSPRAIPTIQEKGLTFIGVKIEGGSLHTGKTEKDTGKFERFVKNQASNERMWTVDITLPEFDATGIIVLDEEIIGPDDLFKLMQYGGKMFGIGTARPQGYGRFTIPKWTVLDSTEAKPEPGTKAKS